MGKISDIPANKEVYIDANVLVHIHGMVISEKDSDRYLKQLLYSSEVALLLSSKRKIVTTWLNVMELMSVHEQLMYVEYKAVNSLPDSFTKKDFRRNSTQRTRVQSELKRILNEVKSYYTIITAEMTGNLIENFVISLTSHKYDLVDFAVVETVLLDGITEVITDDTDFHSDKRINVYPS